jgi:kynurenine formamidase
MTEAGEGAEARASRRIEALASDMCNWGRWGPDDQAGTLNFITPDKIIAAAGLVRTGEVVSLGIELGSSGPQVAHPRRFNPLHYMLTAHEFEWPGGASSADDVIVMPLQAGTQWDALAHVAYRGRMYGDRPSSDVGVTGARTNSISAVRDRVITRGVLVDLPRWKSVPALDSGYPITPQDLEGALAAQGTAVGAGDILLIRTGFLAACRSRGWQGFSRDAPGLGLATLPWLHERMLAGVAADTSALEVRPFDLPGVDLPFHIVALVFMGLLIGEIFDLEELAGRCAADGRYDFLLAAPPLNVANGLGSPINPYAVR